MTGSRSRFSQDFTDELCLEVVAVARQADAQVASQMPDLVTRDFGAGQPGRTFVGDITYSHTWAGFIHVATVIDSCPRRSWAGRSMITCTPSSSRTR